jgi:hypothetical protein
MTTAAHIHERAREGQLTLSSEKRHAVQFRTRKEAADAAKFIHWPPKSAIRIEIMGFYIWALADEHMRYVTRTGYDVFRKEVEGLQSHYRARGAA